MISIEDLTYRIGSRILFDGATLRLSSGGKFGLIGPNGCGKTTLFRLILGLVEIDGGEILLGSGAKLTYLKQEIEDLSIGLMDYIIAADSELARLKKVVEGGQHGDDLAAYEKYDAIGGYGAEARAASLLAGLGFRQEDFGRTLGEFSGGWQVRASLAATLFAPSNCLLLDEPTNHLDLETALWLENYLAKTDKMVLMISHEKQFLNRICDHIVSVANGKLLLFSGNYDRYVETRQRQEVAQIKNIENLRKKRDHMQSFIDRFGAKATKAKQAQSRAKMIEKMEIPEMPNSNYAVNLKFSDPVIKVDRKLIVLENVAAGYGEKIVLKAVSLSIESEDRIAILGANGNGKSTLAKVLCGALQPLSGAVTFARNAQIAYFSQQQADELRIGETPIEAIRRQRDFTETQARSYLAQFGIRKNLGETVIGKLSGGEKSRVLFAINSLSSPHAMIFDEPTNHLDIEAREALVGAIGRYKGAVVLITHDFYTLSKTCSKFFIVGEGGCKQFDGSLDDYRAMLLRSGGNQPSNARAGKSHDGQNFSAKRQSNGTCNSARRKRLSSLEASIAQFENEKLALEKKLSTAYDTATQRLYADCCKKLSELEDEWLNFCS
jgi:ATP-binding cassette subfamily F protein 3